MASINDLDYVKQILLAKDEANYGDWARDELLYAEVGNIIDFGDDVNVPESWHVEVIENSTETDYDSYGNAYAQDAYVVIAIMDGINTALYKIPGEYSSYEGWSWYLNKTTQVQKRAKLVTTYEWENVND